MLLERPLPAWFSSGPVPPSRAYDHVDIGRRARFALLVAELALHEHVLEHGRSPKTLAELVPRYLPSIPLDPSGQPLVYRQRSDGYILYSVGANGVDDGGVAAEWSDMLQGHGDLFLDAPAPNAAKSAILGHGADGKN